MMNMNRIMLGVWCCITKLAISTGGWGKSALLIIFAYLVVWFAAEGCIVSCGVARDAMQLKQNYMKFSYYVRSKRLVNVQEMENDRSIYEETKSFKSMS